MLYVIYDTCYEICKDLNKLPSYFEFEEYRKIINEKLVNMSRTDKNKNLNGGGHPLVMEPGGLVWFLYLVMIYVLIVVNTPSFVINSQIKLLRDEFARIPDRANKWEEERQKLIKMRGEHVDIGPAPIEMWQKTLMKAIKEKENELQRVQSSFYEKHQWWKRET